MKIIEEIRKMVVDIHLERRDASHEELVSSDIILSHLGTNISLSKTRPNLVPILGINDMIPQPSRESLKPILSITPPWHIIATIGARDHKGEDQKDQEKSYENGHAAEIEC
jgi:hypothetical protein